MESPRKFNDCYFYYYSTCTKGDNCVFRHEPSALGCETTCAAWQQGKCMDKRCKLRHMELRKNRKQIPCYWENQPGGCRKKHCPFMHKNPDARTDGIAPSQPGPPRMVAGVMPEVVSADSPQLPPVAPVPPPAPAPVPLLWQQPRQVVLDSTILASSELLAGRRILTQHEAPPPIPYSTLPVDPLVVNFEEESDNESAPSSTPTKAADADESHKIVHTKETELMLLEKIQAESAAYYSYNEAPLPAEPQRERKLVRSNLSTKYDRLSLDDIAGKNQAIREARRTSLDFEIFSLDEIRARRKVNNDAIIQTTPITLNLKRKRKLSTHESITSGSKVIKVVRSNSVIYRKLDNGNSVLNKSDTNVNDNELERRNRTVSEQSDCVEIYDDELDDCIKFKEIMLSEHIEKPKLVRSKSSFSNSDDIKDVTSADNIDYSGSEVQIIDLEDSSQELSRIHIIDSDIIDVSTSVSTGAIDFVDLSDDLKDNDVVVDLDGPVNIPDVVASCVSKGNCL